MSDFQAQVPYNGGRDYPEIRKASRAFLAQGATHFRYVEYDGKTHILGWILRPTEREALEEMEGIKA